MTQTPAFGPTIWAEIASAGVPDGVVTMVVPLDVKNPDGSVRYPAGTVLYAAGATGAQKAAVAQVVVAHDPTKPLPAPRRATLAALFDPMTAAQRAAIAPDHLMRLQAVAAMAPDGTVFIGNDKLIRAAADFGVSPDAWFTLAGA